LLFIITKGSAIAFMWPFQTHHPPNNIAYSLLIYCLVVICSWTRCPHFTILSTNLLLRTGCFQKAR